MISWKMTFKILKLFKVLKVYNQSAPIYVNQPQSVGSVEGSYPIKKKLTEFEKIHLNA